MTDQDSTRTPYIPNESVHPWRRFVAVGDSFTEGIGDPDPNAPGAHRGWADRVAEVLGQQVDDFAYANLAVRGSSSRRSSPTRSSPLSPCIPTSSPSAPGAMM